GPSLCSHHRCCRCSMFLGLARTQDLVALVTRTRLLRESVHVHRLPSLLLGIVMLPSGLGVHIHAQAPADTALYAVPYFDVLPSARAAAVAALKLYRDASRQEDGYV